MSAESKAKSIANIIIWFIASMLLVLPAYDYIELLRPFAVFSFLIANLFLALIGTVVQYIFISSDNFKLNPFLSIVSIGTLVLAVFLLLLAMYMNAEIEFLFQAIRFYAIPIYLVTTLSYYTLR